MHGGLGRGNVGVVAAKQGVGKTPLLVQIALDDLMRDRKVLHISHEHAVDHVRAYYDEIFHDIAQSTHLENPEAERADIERNRLIYSHLGHVKAAPVSLRGGESYIAKILDSVRFARDVAHFEPDVIIVDGFDFKQANEDGIRALGALARQRSVELWAAATVDDGDDTGGRLPLALERFKADLNVVVFLEADRDIV